MTLSSTGTDLDRPFSAVDRGVLDDYVRFGFRTAEDGVELKCTPESEARTFESVDYTVFDRLEAIDADITVIGSTDGGPPAMIAPRIAEAIPTADFVLWDDTHFGPFSDPERAAREIRATLQ